MILVKVFGIFVEKDKSFLKIGLELVLILSVDCVKEIVFNNLIEDNF